MTLREIVIALRCIDVRRHNNYALQAALHGHKIKLKSLTPQAAVETSFTNEESAAADRAMKKAMMRMKFKK